MDYQETRGTLCTKTQDKDKQSNKQLTQHKQMKGEQHGSHQKNRGWTEVIENEAIPASY